MIVCFVKIWRPPRQDIGSFEDWRKFGDPQKFGEFYQIGGRTCIKLLVDRFLYVNKQKKNSSAIWVNNVVISRLHDFLVSFEVFSS